MNALQLPDQADMYEQMARDFASLLTSTGAAVQHTVGTRVAFLRKTFSGYVVEVSHRGIPGRSVVYENAGFSNTWLFFTNIVSKWRAEAESL